MFGEVEISPLIFLEQIEQADVTVLFCVVLKLAGVKTSGSCQVLTKVKTIKSQLQSFTRAT